MLRLSFVVLGQPVPQGSARAFVTKGGRAVVTSDNTELRPWRDTVSWAARQALGEHSERPSFPITGPVSLVLAFHVRRPVSERKTVDVYPIKPPDLDKMLRAIGDSLTNAGVVRDDALITDVVMRKRYVVTPDLAKIYDPLKHRTEPCVVIQVKRLEVPT
jgi:crossover junction endodeoxyribonuclease RusA